MNDSYIDHGKSGAITFSGPDAVAYHRAVSLQFALKLYKDSGGRIIPTRGMTITKMLAIATQITQKPYKRGQIDAAIADVKAWADTMRAALPEYRS